MAYYFVANYDVNDKEMYQQYQKAVRPTLGQYGAKVLIVDHTPNALEGESHRVFVVLEFESEEAASRWYNAPEYQAIINLRFDATEGWARGVPQFEMPAA